MEFIQEPIKSVYYTFSVNNYICLFKRIKGITMIIIKFVIRELSIQFEINFEICLKMKFQILISYDIYMQMCICLWKLTLK